MATLDCIAVGVLSVDDGATRVTLRPESDHSGLVQLGAFALETEGQLSVRDVYNREYIAMGVQPGQCEVKVWGNDHSEPNVVTFEVSAEHL